MVLMTGIRIAIRTAIRTAPPVCGAYSGPYSGPYSNPYTGRHQVMGTSGGRVLNVSYFDSVFKVVS